MFCRSVRSACLILAISCAGCGQQRTNQSETISATGDDLKFRVETVASGLQVPWAFAWLPNKDLLFTERPGRVRIIESGKLRAEPVFVVPDVESVIALAIKHGGRQEGGIIRKGGELQAAIRDPDGNTIELYSG